MDTPKIGVLDGLVIICESFGSGTFGLKTPFLYTEMFFLAFLVGALTDDLFFGDFFGS